LIYKNKTNNKVSIVSTKDTNIIVGVVSHDKNIHDSKTLDAAINHANSNRTKVNKGVVG
jgi:IS5 family transposase